MLLPLLSPLTSHGQRPSASAALAILLLSVTVASPVFAQDAAVEDEAAAEETRRAEDAANGEEGEPDAAESPDYFELMQVFADTFEQIDRNYVKEVDRRRLIEGAVRGMLNELDPYSNYISPEELGGFTEDIEQEFGGIGVQVEYDPQLKALEIVAPLPGSPAFEVGLEAGDKIVRVNGELLSSFAAGREQFEAVKRLKGAAGEQVEVGVVRAGVDGIKDFNVTRRVIQLPTVFGASRDDNGDWEYVLPDQPGVGYIRVSHFTRRTAQEVREAVRVATEAGAEGLIIDLRFNPGGLLTSAVEIVDLFLDSGKIVSTEGRNSRPRLWNARKFGTNLELPLVVLINHYSASASEITAAALQDHGRAVIVGERSWGKGSVQNVIDVESGQSALKLTTASYFRPSGKNIHRFAGAKDEDEWGVTPDDGMRVELTPEQMGQLQRTQRDVYMRRPADAEFVDPQLQKAVEALRSQPALQDAA